MKPSTFDTHSSASATTTQVEESLFSTSSRELGIFGVMLDHALDGLQRAVLTAITSFGAAK
jgi:hypothetical protein